jgi:hypothetical protein
MEETEIEIGIRHVYEAVAAGRMTCSPSFVVDISYVEADIRDNKLEYDVNTKKLENLMAMIPFYDRKELEAMFEDKTL